MCNATFARLCEIEATYHAAARAWYLDGRRRDGAAYRAFCEAEAVESEYVGRFWPLDLTPEQSERWTQLAADFGPTAAEYDAGWAAEVARSRQAGDACSST